ncbi:MAG: alpha/beta hydrolase fold domain-containing protein [Candidatus Thermoplasmatota archaeon]|nr:alpha/beta hydrolase fold domain-containing protein [Candidatus Thermoplasmatota archaeon]
MRVALILTTLMLSASLAGCFGDSTPEYSDFEGCTDEEVEECEVTLPEENETQEELIPPPTDLVFASPDGVDLRVAVYSPDSEGPHPVIMWVHGGGWKQGDRLIGNNHASQQIVGDGIWAVVSVEYRLSNEAIWPAQLSDLRTAVNWIQDNADTYNLDASTIVAWGSSAGGHLASMLAVAPDPDLNISAAIDWFGPTDLSEMNGSTSVADLLGCDPSGDESECASQTVSASPAQLANDQTVPMLIMHGTDDESVPFNQSTMLHDALVTPNWYVTVEGGIHSTHPWQKEFIVDIVREFLDNVTQNSVVNRTFSVDAGPVPGTWEGEVLPNIQAAARPAEGDWMIWKLWDSLDADWNNSSTEHDWVLIQFAATDCGHCWNGAEAMSNLHAQYSENVTFFTFIINFSWSDSSWDEIAAFQDETDFIGCNNGDNCMDRPGEPHNWTYVDDRELYWFYSFHMQGTPSYVIVAPNGIVHWHSVQSENSVSDALESLFPEEG